MQGHEESKDLSILSKIFKGTAVVTDIHFIKENTTRIMKERKKKLKKIPPSLSWTVHRNQGFGKF